MVNIKMVDGIPCICLENDNDVVDEACEVGGEAVDGNLLDEVFDSIETILKFLKDKIRELIWI